MTNNVTLQTYGKDNNIVISENTNIANMNVLLEQAIIAGVTHYKNIERDTIDTEVQCKTYFTLSKSEEDDAIEFQFTDEEIVVHFNTLFPQKKSFFQKLFNSKNTQCLLLDNNECKAFIADYFKLDRASFESKHNEK